MSNNIGSPLFWSGFVLIVLFLLALDLGFFHRKAQAVTFRDALIWSVGWVILSLSFGACVYNWFGKQKAMEFFAGYLIQYALSVDNIFVFILIFSYFAVPAHLHYRVLFWGIVGALIMRAVFILVGAALIEAFHWVIYIFGGFLVYTGIKVLRGQGAEINPEQNPIVRLFQRIVPMVPEYQSGWFLVKRAGRTFATPLALVLLTVETTDVLFALDSIPANFAVSTDPFIIFTSNICSILGLRSLYFLLAAVIGRFVYLNVGLGLVLMFVGAKMILTDIYKISITLSLSIVAIVLASSILLSLLRTNKASNSSISE